MMKHILLAATAIAAMPAIAASPVMTPADTAATKTMFETIINTPTVLGRGKVPEMAAYLAGEFKKAGWTDADVMIMPYATTNPAGTQKDQTAALMVIWRAAGKPSAKPLMLMGHMDVVEAKREDSTTDPFVLTEKDGYYYGRGTTDMKSGIVGISRALIQLRAAGFKPKRDVVVYFTGDEETNGIGAAKGAKEWLAMMGNPALGLNADGGGIGYTMDDKPLGASLQTAEKNVLGLHLHRSQPRRPLVEAAQGQRDLSACSCP